ncbi:hypothetical protein JCM11641_006175 [Rhodosporidiobolus odoratus]
MAQAERDAPPELPPFPDLSPLRASFSTSSSSPPSSPHTTTTPPPSSPHDNPSDIWAQQSTPPYPVPTTVSTAGYNAQYTVSPPASPPQPVNLDDLDPFAPATPSSASSTEAFGSIHHQAVAVGTATTLGSTVKKESRLELLEGSGSETGGSPTDDNDLQAQQAKQTRPEAVGHRRDGSGSFFRDMLRSISGTPVKEQEQAAQPTRDGPLPPLPPLTTADTASARPSTPIAPSTSTHQPPPVTPQTPTGPSTLAKPFTSIASVFRSTPKPFPAPSPAGSTPQPGSSPVLQPKGGFMTVIAGMHATKKGKGKGTAETGEKGGEYNEKIGEGSQSGQERGEPVFDFSRFLEQMRSRSADPIAKYLRSFLKEFSRQPPLSPTDQTRVINDFLDFIAGKMRACDPWKSIVEVDWRDDAERAEQEFDMAMEAMEKLVMNRLWHLTFTPALDLSTFPGHMSPSGDVERDHVLSQRIRLFQWLEPKHLDLPIPSPSTSSLALELPTSSLSSPTVAADTEESEKQPALETPEGGDFESEKTRGKRSERQTQSFLDFAQRELCKMNQYKAPRDKLICVLNCCKVIFGLMRHVAAGEEGADTFIPFLIFVVIKANPENLVSNLQYIQRFRNPEKLSGEGGYYLSSLSAAISFVETLDASSLSNIDQAGFEHHVAAAVKKLAAEEPPPPAPPSDRRHSGAFEAASRTSRPASPTGGPPRFATPNNDPTAPPVAETEAASASLVSSGDDSGPGTPTNLSFPESTRQMLLRGTDSVEKAMSKPLGALAKIFDQLEQTANEITGQQYSSSPRSPGMPPAPLPPSPTPSLGLSGTPTTRPSHHKRRSYLAAPNPVRHGLPPLPPSTGSLHLRSPPSPDPAMYVAEDVGDEDVMREIDRQHEEQRMAALGTLESVFPVMEREVLEMVLLSSANDVGKAIDSLLEMA